MTGEALGPHLFHSREIADSVEAGNLPAAYSHKVPVPGLAHSAVPGFKDVDEFESRQLIQNRGICCK